MTGFARINRQMTIALLALALGRLAMLGLWLAVPTKPGMGLLAFVLILDSLVLAWQILLLRRARNLTGTGFASFVMALLAIIAIAFVLSTGVSRTATALLREPVPPAPQALLRLDGTRAYLSGEIEFDTYNAMQATLSSQPSLKTLELDSAGGRIAAARGIARLVRETGLDTHVSGICASACTVIFAAGQTRSMAPQARIGFHGYRLVSGVVTLSTSEEEDRDKALLAAAGIDPSFLDRAFAIPHDEMWFPSPPELRAAGVLHD